MHLDYATGVWFLVVSGVLIGFAGYMMTPEERDRALAAARAYAARFTQMALGGAVTQPFGKALAERTPRPFVAPAIAAFSVIVFLSIGLGSPSSTDGTIAWGGNVGPLTTNGGWHRLVAA